MTEGKQRQKVTEQKLSLFVVKLVHSDFQVNTVNLTKREDGYVKTSGQNMVTTRTITL